MNIFDNAKLTDLGIEAATVDRSKLTMQPIPVEGMYGIPVLNKQGYVRTTQNEYIEAFVESAKDASGLLLEIGCAYGNIVRRVLQTGKKIVACDLGAEHLEILIRDCPGKYLKNLHVYPGRFPEEVSFPARSFYSILASRVLHFLDGRTFEQGLRKINKWLVPEGKLYFTGLSIYKSYIKDNFWEQYQKNIVNGKKWPGEIENQLDFSPQHRGIAPEFIHVFDIPQLELLLPEFGFTIDKIGFFDYRDDALSDNKGHIGFIATKV